MRRSIHGHGALLHRLEQRGLRLRGRAIDLVREHQIGEHRAGPECELVRPRQQRYTGDIGWHEVGRELDALEAYLESERQRAHQQCLGRAGHALEQHVAAREQADERFARGGVLPQHDRLERL